MQPEDRRVGLGKLGPGAPHPGTLGSLRAASCRGAAFELAAGDVDVTSIATVADQSLEGANPTHPQAALISCSGHRGCVR